MATKIIVALEDDLDGGPADETVRFGLGGAEYEIDLNAKNARAFRRQLAPFLDHARRAGRGQRRRPVRTAARRQRSGDIRAWAKEQGIAVSARGRIPASVAQQYDAATSGPARRRAMTAPSSSALLAIEKRAAAIIRKLFDDGELSGAQVCRRCGAVVDPGYAGVHAGWHAHRSWPVTTEKMVGRWAD